MIEAERYKVHCEAIVLMCDEFLRIIDRGVEYVDGGVRLIDSVADVEAMLREDRQHFVKQLEASNPLVS